MSITFFNAAIKMTKGQSFLCLFVFYVCFCFVWFCSHPEGNSGCGDQETVGHTASTDGIQRASRKQGQATKSPGQPWVTCVSQLGFIS